MQTHPYHGPGNVVIDSCQHGDFTRMAGGHNPRAKRHSRLRQRVLHKFAYIPERNDGAYGCTGCGRCAEVCPEQAITVDAVAEIDGGTIGGVLVYTFKDTLGVAYVASRIDYWPLGVDQALFWKTLQMAVEKGFKVYDIGKTSPHAEGLMTYKKRWGGQELETPCFYYPGLKGVSSYNDERRLSHRIMKLAWQKLPRPAARLGGRFVYRHLG